MRNSDVEHRFRQPSDLWYLTGFTEPEALAVIAPGRAEKFTLFVRPRDPERETWTGRRAGVDGAKTKFGADSRSPSPSWPPSCRSCSTAPRNPITSPATTASSTSSSCSTLAHLRQAERRGMRAPRRIADLGWTLHELRLFKDAEDARRDAPRREVTRQAHTARCARRARGASEYEVEALID